MRIDESRIREVSRAFCENQKIEWPEPFSRDYPKLSRAFSALHGSVTKNAIEKGISEDEYLAALRQALSWLYEFNAEIGQSLGSPTPNEYSEFWSQIGVADGGASLVFGNYQGFPMNMGNMRPIVDAYSKNISLQSRHVDQVLAEYLAFLQLNSFARSIRFEMPASRPWTPGFIYRAKCTRMLEAMLPLLRPLHLVYMSCSEDLFNPRVVYELALKVRMENDFYEAVFFDLLEIQIERRRHEVRNVIGGDPA